ncbi:MAG: type I pantothenate kinase [Acidimicrobiia bacterium]
MEVREGYAPVARLVARRAEAVQPLIVGIGGGVAVGKSTAAAAVAELFEPGRVEVVATDGFLLPNAVLEERRILHRKGFPESYDSPAVEAFLDAVRSRDRAVTVPVYSHVTYDVVAGERVTLAPPEVLVLEGVNALQFSDRLDVAVYLHASEDAMEDWYVTRFLQLCQAPPPGSFYEQFGELDVDARRSFASGVWHGVNLVNLRECIRPTRGRAHVIVEKRADHSVGRVDVMTLLP